MGPLLFISQLGTIFTIDQNQGIFRPLCPQFGEIGRKGLVSTRQSPSRFTFQTHFPLVQLLVQLLGQTPTTTPPSTASLAMTAAQNAAHRERTTGRALPTGQSYALIETGGTGVSVCTSPSYGPQTWTCERLPRWVQKLPRHHHLGGAKRAHRVEKIG